MAADEKASNIQRKIDKATLNFLLDMKTVFDSDLLAQHNLFWHLYNGVNSLTSCYVMDLDEESQTRHRSSKLFVSSEGQKR
jgi:hypothetical protein